MDLPTIRPTPPQIPQCNREFLRNAGMLDFLDNDPRPTLVLDASTQKLQGLPRTSPYWNDAMATVDQGDLLAAILDGPERPDVTTSPFRSWFNNQKNMSESLSCSGFRWTKFLAASQWTIVSGALIENHQTNGSLLSEGTALSKRMSNSKSSTFDWTNESAPLRMSSHIRWARSIDWASTPLGPMKTWSSQLRSITNLVMQDPRPAVVFYGPKLIMVYNEPYIALLGGFHPCLGVSARITLADVWPQYFEPIIQRNLVGETVEQENYAVHLKRNSFMEEAYFSVKFIPVLDSNGATVGHYEPLVETTREVLAQRQSQVLLEMSEEIPRARNSDTYWDLATEVLSRNAKDIPFALLYSIQDNSGDSSSNARRFSESTQECTLRGLVGIPGESPVAAASLKLQENIGFTPYLLKAMKARKPITVQFSEDPQIAELMREIQWQGWGDPCRAAVVCPLNPTSSKDNILGFIIIGLNPRRPYDENYHHFILVASRLLSTSLTSILLHEEDINRRERAIATMETIKFELSQQLNESQKEVERSMLKFQHFAERCDIGIFILNMDGEYLYRNDAWFNILHPVSRDMDLDQAWATIVDDESAELGRVKFGELVETKEHQSFELRLKRTWSVLDSSYGGSRAREEPKWVLTSIFLETKDDGEALQIVGSITDISQQKWAEKLQTTQALNAQESKRQLENFIDTTSHEIRNPLSAIVQCADSIISSNKEPMKPMEQVSALGSIMATTLDAAETILQCSKHMKTIVDDVLTMSKLDSGLFIMTPVDVQLESIAKDAVKMFEGEARSAGIDLALHIEESCRQTSIDAVSLDPTRVLQILINLITNAIKFTRLKETRKISVCLGISQERPHCDIDGRVTFAHPPEAVESQNLQMDWAKGDIVYLIFSVTDTGRGLSQAERELLFARFSQGSARTHIDYGGSGLGLFISRRLTEMHGGAIGFASEAGKGSTFSFYVKSRESKAPPEQRLQSEVVVGRHVRAQIAARPLKSQHGDDKPALPAGQANEKEIVNSDLYVLIVEDNLVNQRVLAKQLKQLGMKVAIANHGQEALDYLRTTSICAPPGTRSDKPLSLILMDWEMPVMDGLTCVRNIRKWQQEGIVQGHIPVIAVTANVRSEQVETAMAAGMDNVMSKPFRIPELCACIHKTLRDTLATI